MITKDLKSLKKFLQLCRQQGVDSIRFEGIEVHLGPMPEKPQRSTTTKSPKNTFIPGGVTEDTKIITEELTEEQLMFYSSSDGQAQ